MAYFATWIFCENLMKCGCNMSITFSSIVLCCVWRFQEIAMTRQSLLNFWNRDYYCETNFAKIDKQQWSYMHGLYAKGLYGCSAQSQQLCGTSDMAVRPGHHLRLSTVMIGCTESVKRSLWQHVWGTKWTTSGREGLSGSLELEFDRFRASFPSAQAPNDSTSLYIEIIFSHS